MRREYSAGIIVYTIQLIDKVPTRLYLLLYYPKGYWDLVKGHVEPNESSLEAAYRELKEETGLTVEIYEGFKEDIDYIFTKEEELVAKKVTYFIGKATSPEVTLSYEHAGYVWLPYAEALAHLTYKNAQQVIAAAEDYLTK
jgi:8-oxo-dGTP pyrophosphatase MutT (NUDIX family)